MKKFFQSLNVGQRLGTAFGFLIVLIMVSSGLALHEFQYVHASIDKIINENNRKSEILNTLLRHHMTAARILRDLLLVDEAGRTALVAELETVRAESDALRKELADIPTTAAGHQLREQYQLAQDATRPLNNHILELVSAGETAAAHAVLYDDALHIVAKRNEVVTRMIAFQTEQNAQEEANIQSMLSFTRNVLIGFGGFASVLGALLSWLITRSLTRPLNQATRIAESIAEGRLDNVIGVQAGDETGRLLTSMGRMQQQLQAVLAAQSDMAQHHDAGHISYQIDDGRFPGDYGRMVRESNRWSPRMSRCSNVWC
jgi:methyl-accepting chemotaxis protein